MAGTYDFVSWIVGMISLELALALSTPAADKTQCFVYLSFNSFLQLIKDISSDFQNLL